MTSKFSERLKELRSERGLSFKKLENAVGISDATLCRWENGQLENICEHIINLAKFFEVSVEYLLGLKEE